MNEQVDKIVKQGDTRRSLPSPPPSRPTSLGHRASRSEIPPSQPRPQAVPQFYPREQMVRAQYQGYLQSRYTITDTRAYELHQQQMDDFIRAKRLQGTFYEPLYDHDLSQFPTGDEEEDEPMQAEVWGQKQPQTIEDIWDDEYGEFGNDLSDFEWYPKVQPLLN